MAEQEKCPKCGATQLPGATVGLETLQERPKFKAPDGVFCVETNDRACLQRQLARRDKADAAMHKRLALAGFDEGVSFHDAVALLLTEFGDAKAELAEGRREGLEAAVELVLLHIPWDKTERVKLIGAIRRLAAEGQQEKCKKCGGSREVMRSGADAGVVTSNHSPSYGPCPDCTGTAGEKGVGE